MSHDVVSYHSSINERVGLIDVEASKRMGYGFIKVVSAKEPIDPGMDYTVKSKATDVPK